MIHISYVISSRRESSYFSTDYWFLKFDFSFLIILGKGLLLVFLSKINLLVSWPFWLLGRVILMFLIWLEMVLVPFITSSIDSLLVSIDDYCTENCFLIKRIFSYFNLVSSL